MKYICSRCGKECSLACGLMDTPVSACCGVIVDVSTKEILRLKPGDEQKDKLEFAIYDILESRNLKDMPNVDLAGLIIEVLDAYFKQGKTL